jgi:hypothetical protein
MIFIAAITPHLPEAAIWIHPEPSGETDRAERKMHHNEAYAHHIGAPAVRTEIQSR